VGPPHNLKCDQQETKSPGYILDLILSGEMRSGLDLAAVPLRHMPAAGSSYFMITSFPTSVPNRLSIE
jgi:hypothetical protein